ncbi:MAG: hypothetical protein HY055_09310 [Magnetospirillum sp.]|nr:hypothetical protein [Magnetospirillum sp.]
MDRIMEIIHVYKEVIAFALVGLLTLLILKRYWDEISFWLMDLGYGLPVIGRVVRLSKSLEFNAQSRWFHSEETLAQAYIDHYDKLHADPEYYDKCSSYLARAGETGRHPFAWYMWILVFAMVAIEAMGFSYVLAGFTIPGASENVLKLGALGISLLVSVLLVGFTHWTGKELYTNSLMAKARSWWSHDSRQGAKLVESDHEITIEKNNADDGEPKYVQLLNRVSATGDAEKRFNVTIGTAILVIAIAIGATWVRGIVLEREIQAETTGIVSQIKQGPSQSFYPSALTQPQAQADIKSVEDGNTLTREGGWGTFIVLAVIFVFMQIFGVLTGFKFGFVGKESPGAYDTVSRFKTRNAYEAHHKTRRTAILRTGGRRLLDLQQRLARNVRERGTTAEQKDAASHSESRDIHAYLERVLRQEDETDRKKVERDAANAAQRQSSAKPQIAPASPKIGEPISRPQPDQVGDIDIEETDEQMEARIRAEMRQEVEAGAEQARLRKEEERRAREAAIRARLQAQQAE